MSKAPVTIYALKDDAARIVYVGQTANLGFRLAQHETDPKRRKVFASVSVLEIVPRADANAVEKRWIQQLIAEGQPLSNINHNPMLKKPKTATPARPSAAMFTLEPMEDETLITVPEAIKRSGVSDSGVRMAINRGTLPHVVKYGHKLIRLADLETWQVSRRMGRPKKNGPSRGNVSTLG